MMNLFTKNKEGAYNGIRRTAIINLLRNAGYRNLSDGGMLKDSILCRESSNKIELANLDDMWNYILSFAEGNEHKEELIRKYKENMLQRIVAHLDRIQYTPYKDDRNTCRLFFQNGIIEIDRNSTSHKLTPWDLFELNDCKVWAENVNEVSVNPDLFKDYKKGVFYKFCQNAVSTDGIKALMIALGYLMHSFKDESKPYIIVFSDGDENDNNKSNGGTGKSLIANDFLSLIRNVSFIDGKKYKEDSQFNFQSINPYSDIILIDDVTQKFNYKGLYPSSTNVMTIERKQIQPKQVAFSQSGKFVITSNYGLIANDGSDRRRRRVIGITSYYGEHLTPFDEFGHNFFRDWVGDKAIEWQYCIGFMAECVKLYFENNCDVENYNHTTIETRALANAQNPDLMEYCTDNYAKYLGEECALAHTEWTDIVSKITGKFKDAGWKAFKRAMEAIGLKSSNGTQIRIEGVNARHYHFIVDDIDKLHRVLKGANINTDHNGIVIIEDIESDSIPDEFTSEDESPDGDQMDIPNF
jgi:hypothetical protein